MAGEEPTEREYAATAERLGQKLKAGLNGGKSQLLKVLKVSHSLPSPPAPPSPHGRKKNPKQLFENRFPHLSPPNNSQDASNALSRVGQGEDGGELKDLPKKLVLDALLNHKDKVRSVEQAQAPPNPQASPPPRKEEKEKEKNVFFLVEKKQLTSPLCCVCKQQEVRLYTALCLSDVLRIFAPEEPYQDDETLKVNKQNQ